MARKVKPRAPRQHTLRQRTLITFLKKYGVISLPQLNEFAQTVAFHAPDRGTVRSLINRGEVIESVVRFDDNSLVKFYSLSSSAYGFIGEMVA